MHGPAKKKIYQAIEDSFAENFYSTYEDKVNGVLKRIRKTDISKDDAIEKILDLIEKELGDLPDELEHEWRKAISDAWDAGQEFHKGNDGKDVKTPKVNANKHVLDFSTMPISLMSENNSKKTKTSTISDLQ